MQGSTLEISSVFTVSHINDSCSGITTLPLLGSEITRGPTVFIRINAPGAMHFSKGRATITYKKINSRVQWQWAIMDTFSLDLACHFV